MELLQNEKRILESDNKQIVLTSQRLRYYETTGKNSNFTSIMLDRISSISLTYQSNTMYLIIGIITIPIVVGLLLIFIYFKTKKHVVSIVPDGGSAIAIEINGMKRNFLMDFINDVEKAAYELKNRKIAVIPESIA